ncbi:MAG: hypothetical protein U5R31_03880 [Acidimicrobiia bacterium]|nr:hypothetical protein [Acidimicrobiia bacterium]
MHRQLWDRRGTGGWAAITFAEIPAAWLPALPARSGQLHLIGE